LIEDDDVVVFDSLVAKPREVGVTSVAGFAATVAKAKTVSGDHVQTALPETA
jgi:hypothetical protein